MENIKIHPIYDLYCCNPDTGEIFNLRNKNNIGGCNSSGYNLVRVRSTNENVYKGIMSHRFVWECINDKIPKGYEIDHINSNRTDNRISNLRCISLNENRKYASINRIRNGNYCRNGHALKRFIKAINENNEICCFNCKNQCAKYFKISPALIYLIVENKNRAKSANTEKGKIRFEYVEESNCENLIVIPRTK
jgi:hypothetical protein